MIRGDFTVASMVAWLGDDVQWTSGPLTAKLEGVCSLSGARRGMVSFCRHSDERLDVAARRPASAVIVPPDRRVEAAPDGPALVAVANPRLAFIRVASRLHADAAAPGVDPTAVVDASARIDPTARIGPHVVVSRNCEVGAQSVLHAGVCLYANSRIGARVVLHAGVVVGVDGFGYERDGTGRLHKFPHIGGVVIEDDVEVGANCCIARGALDDTRIGRGSKLDGLVHVAHNCQVGPDSLLTAQTMLAGSVTVGARVWLSPGCRVLNNTTIGDDAVIGMGANVLSDVGAGTTVVAVPARAPLGRR